MSTYQDIKISGDDIVIDGDGQAVIIEDRDVIAQDLIHAIRESGYLAQLVAERSSERRRLLLTQLKILAEEDTRIIPGTVEISGDPGSWGLYADTYEFGDIELEITG